ncbi:hypothetical protein [Acidipila sp. EB88]|uniref:hypothetical protein n=1 Tax=Acidipila sp. EB88 TaxID=2305226 RepID=UPI000F5F49EF|nr:hypothetical protein [Acidipila sp. EB88]
MVPAPALPELPARMLYTRPEAAELLAMSLRQLDDHIAMKRIRVRRSGSRYVRIPHAELIRLCRTDRTD